MVLFWPCVFSLKKNGCQKKGLNGHNLFPLRQLVAFLGIISQKKKHLAEFFFYMRISRKPIGVALFML
ncbi:unknown protein [Simkania negevensis Z]|uniref:Uncharacterized protein n=1 Tax=Simkania negevensis (strain ATCC VR-1471 / DSM 27360 / Z) TaxID=331113 RepID=F8L3C0_SIMNZ|nr:unknown protein [Simkania negevensis Z]